GRTLRIFFATDIHGAERCFRKFLAAAQHYEADVLLLGGDVAGKGLVPIRGRNGSLTAEVRGDLVTVDREEEERLRAEINRLGFYSVVMAEAEAERLSRDPEELDRVFRRDSVPQIGRWCELPA